MDMRLRNVIPVFLILFLVSSIFLAPSSAQASDPWPYAPGATTDPACAPTDVGCDVESLTGTGTVGQFPYYAAAGDALSATSTVTILTSGNVGIGTTSPYSTLSVAGQVAGQNFVTTSTAATSTFAGAVGIGTASPASMLDVVGNSANQTPLVVQSGGAYSDIQQWIDPFGGTRDYIDYTGSLFLQPYSSPTNGVGTLVINANSTVPTVPHPGSTIHIVGGNDQFGALYIDSFGNWDNLGGDSYRSIINLRTARGTGAAPLPGVAGDEIGRIAGRGYDGSEFTGSLSALSFMLAENTTPTAQGSYAVIRTTAIGTTGGGSLSTPPETVRFQPSGGMSVGDSTFNATDPGHGSLTMSGKLGISTSTPYAPLTVWGSDTSANTHLANFVDSASTTLMTILDNGSVGIDTNAPTSLLTVATTSESTTNYLPIFNVTHGASSLNAFGVFTTGSGQSTYAKIGGDTAAYSLSVAGGANSNITLDAGLGGTDNNTFLNFSRNGAARWSIGKLANNDFAITNTGNSTQDFTDQYTTGNIGIGTTSPYAPLSVVGQVVGSYFTATSTTATSTFAGGVNVGANDGYFIGGNQVVAVNAGLDQVILGYGNTSNSSGVAVGDGNTADGALATAVGYSNTVSGGGTFNTAIGSGNDATSTSALAMGYFTDAGNTNSVAIGNDTSAFANGAIAIGANITNTTAHSLMIGPSASSVLTILQNGNMGIGTTSPYSMLSVAGQGVFQNIVATSTTATSTFSGGFAAGSGSYYQLLVSPDGEVGIGIASPFNGVNGIPLTVESAGFNDIQAWNAPITGGVSYVDNNADLVINTNDEGNNGVANAGTSQFGPTPTNYTVQNTVNGSTILATKTAGTGSAVAGIAEFRGLSGGTGRTAALLGNAYYEGDGNLTGNAFGNLVGGAFNVFIGSIATTSSVISLAEGASSAFSDAPSSGYPSITNYAGFLSLPGSDSYTTFGTSTGFWMQNQAPTGGSIANLVGLRVDPLTGGTNNYAVYTGENASTTDITANYALYNTGTAPSYFGGAIAVGTTTPASSLTVWAPSTAASSTPLFLVANSASTTLFQVYDSGNATYSGSIYQSSDRRLKTDVTPLDASSSLAEIEGLTPVSYTRIDQPGEGTNLGFLAQDVQQIFPELVSTTSPTSLTPGGTLTLNYIGLIAPIVEAVKSLAGEVSSLASTVTGFAQSFTSQNITASQKLCVGSTCIDQAQLASLLANQGSGNSGGSSSPQPSCTLSASPTSVTAGSRVTLAWNFPEAGTFSIDNGIGSVSPALAGTTTSKMITSDTTFTGTATDGYGHTTTCTTSVSVTEATSSSSITITDVIATSTTATTTSPTASSTSMTGTNATSTDAAATSTPLVSSDSSVSTTTDSTTASTTTSS